MQVFFFFFFFHLLKKVEPKLLDGYFVSSLYHLGRLLQFRENFVSRRLSRQTFDRQEILLKANFQETFSIKLKLHYVQNKIILRPTTTSLKIH
jgi:hypothetical protein